MFVSNFLNSKNKWFFGVLIFMFLLTLYPTESNDVVKNLAFFQLVIGFVPIFLFLLMIVVFIHKKSILSFSTSREKFDWGRVRFSFIVWGIIITFITVLGYCISPTDYQFNFNIKLFLNLFIVASLLLPFQIAFEEYFFRSYLLKSVFILFKKRWISLLISSLLFGFAHYSNPEIREIGGFFILFYIVTGLILTAITLIDDGLEIPLGFHYANNLFTALWVTSDWSVFQTPSLLKYVGESSVDWISITMFLVMNFLFFFICYKKYKWKNWKRKIF